MIPPRERGRHAGYQSSATALSTIGGPLLGGLVVDSAWLSWRRCSFIGVPIAVLGLGGEHTPFVLLGAVVARQVAAHAVAAAATERAPVDVRRG